MTCKDLNCHGECCKGIFFPMPVDSDSRAYFLRHGHVVPEMNAIYLPARCKALANDGSCMDYENRPRICRDYAVGCPACVLTQRLAKEGKV